MSFLFKSTKKQPPSSALPPATRSIRSSDGPDSQNASLNGVAGPKPSSPTPGQSVNNSLNSLAGNEKMAVRTPGENTPGGWPNEKGSSPPSPEAKSLRNMGNGDNAHPRTAMVPTRPPPTDSPYPWSQRRLNFTVSHTNPFPRYGAAVNSQASKDGAVYLMGGLINGSTVKGDLWIVEAGPGNMTCYPVATTSEGPGPRVGHASLLVGNAFIVFGGDTKMDEGDMLDDTLYLLNTSTKQWSRALPAGPRPPGRYGHTLNILGSKIYIFGGQVEGYFFNDLVAFDLNALQQASNRWEILIQNTIDGGPPHGQIPPARTNHTMVTWNDRLYLFGGTDGVHWFNDVWSYDPHTNSWTQLECIGYIPAAREGHAAALVNDVMYIFGGRTEEGNDLGDLAAFRISSRRWYTFQNMGPSPSPRSGHSMTAYGKSIVVLAGEPSSAPRDPNELSLAYFLDTGKIRYPPDSASQTPTNERIQGHRRPSGEKTGIPQGRGMPPRELGDNEIGGARRMGASGREMSQPRSESGSRLPRAAGLPAPSGPPPQQQPPQPRTNGVPSSRQPTRPDREFSPPIDTARAAAFEERGLTSPQAGRDSPARRNREVPTSPTFGENQSYFDADSQTPTQVYKPQTYQPQSTDEPDTTRSGQPLSRSGSRNARNQTNMDRLEETPRESMDMQEPMPAVRRMRSESETEAPPVDSGLGSSPALSQQNDELMKELEAEKSKNAWFASELALARKAGFKADSSSSPVVDERGADTFADDDRPLIEALLKMRTELNRVHSTIESQAASAAERIAEMQKQRDTAINEAVFAKAKLAGQGSQLPDGSRSPSSDADRSNELNKRLASSLGTQSELSRRIEAMVLEIDAEKQARHLAEETADAAQKRVTELDMDRQHNTAEIESLRGELHEAQQAHREAAANAAEAVAAHKMLTVDHREVSGKLESSLAETQDHAAILTSLREAVTASEDKASLLEQKLEEERSQRDGLEQKLAQLKSQHEDRTTELETTSRRLKDAEEMAEKHAEEARTHRQAVLAGLGKVTERDLDPHEAADERVTILQQQVESANALMRQNQAAADSASEKLRRAEERIAGLEAYQEQSSREGLSFRKQLQAAMKDVQGLTAEKTDLQQQLQSQQLETNAIAVQHGALKDILGERGINASEVRRSRALDSPASLSSNRFSTPDLQRVKELEQQLESSLKSHDEMKSQFEEVQDRDANMKREYEEKLTALDNDHQAAVKYLRGTEKMLSKMKQELQRVKNENTEHKKEIEKYKDGSKRVTPEVPAEWETERSNLRKELEDVQQNLKASVASLESRISNMQTQMQSTEDELASTRSLHTSTQADLSTLQATHSQSRSDIEQLQQENSQLEERARDAENKVQLLLDQVESSVDNYRRQSRISEQTTPTMNGTSGHHLRSLSSNSASTANHINNGHSRNTSLGGESMYSQTGAASITSAGPEGGDGRNSMALDSLASELDALRTHWETTNKNYRLSDRFDFEKTPTSASHVASGEFGSLANWRRGLDIDEDEDTSRPGTADGPTASSGHEHGLGGMAVTTPSGMEGGKENMI